MRGRPKPPIPEASHVCCPTGNKSADLPIDALIAQLAERQHGVVTLPQLQLLGLGRSGVSRRASSGRLHRIHRGVYAVGRPHLTEHGHWMAATLACGPKAALSHRSAAGLHGIRRDNRAKTDVSVPSSSIRSRPRIDVHRSSTLEPADVTTVHGIPCTTVARTLVDLGDVVDRRAVERAVDQAEVLRVFDLKTVHEALQRAGRRRGAGTLRAVLEDYEGPTLTRRGLEERFLALCRRASLPSPAVNTWIALNDGIAYEADFLWRSHKLIAETDGRDVHTTRKAFEHDRLRDQRLTLAGFAVVRFTWRQVADEPERVAEALRSLLARLARP
jgi:very-short-patch-repair endonuclease/predicted transcriptional regulator of viral defense system